MDATVVVPTYGRPDMITGCVAALQKQSAPISIVVVDDGSPEPLSGLPDGPHPVTLIRQDNAGPAAARNRGAKQARDGLLMFTDDDCRPHPGWAAAFLAAAGRYDRPVLLGGCTRNAVAGDVFAQTSQDMTDYVSTNSDGAEPFFASNNIAMARDRFLGIGGFDTGYRRAAGEDRALCRAWSAAGYGFASVPDAVIDHFHTMSLRKFWRQHRNYGYGAARYHATAERRRFGILSRPGFYAGLLTSPLRRGLSPRTLVGSALVGLAQVATAQGYRDWRRET